MSQPFRGSRLLEDLPIEGASRNQGDARLRPVVAKDGPKLAAAADTSVHGGRTPLGAWALKNVGTTDLVRYLSQQLSRTVIDKTGLNGHYDVKLEWTPERGEGGPEALGLPPTPDGAAPPTSTAGPSIFTAIQEQLGLKLESAKGPVQIVVIDRAESGFGTGEECKQFQFPASAWGLSSIVANEFRAHPQRTVR